MKYHILSFLISWIFPNKKLRSEFRNFCKKAQNERNVQKIQLHYKKVLKTLKRKFKKKIKIVFLSTTTSKFAYKYIYNAFNKYKNYDVQILLYPYQFEVKKMSSNFKNKLKNNFDYFKMLGYNVDYAFDFKKNEYKKLSQFKPDIVFFEQPYDDVIPKEFKVNNIYKNTLPMFVGYGSQITNGKCEYTPALYKQVFAYFVDNPYIKDFLISKHGFEGSNIVVSGHPKLDAYLEGINYSNQIWKTVTKKRVIWAPHFSFYEKSILRYGTFDWNYKFLYNFAKNHPEIEFIFKPHPEIKRFIAASKLMRIDELQQYYDQWDELANAQLYEDGEYMDMFRTSDCMITDCNSFLYEYLLTKKPIIHLIRKTSVGHNKFGQELIRGYYPARDLNELEAQIKSVVIEGNDALLPVRLDIIKNVLCQPDINGGVTQYIADYVNTCIENGEREI